MAAAYARHLPRGALGCAPAGGARGRAPEVRGRPLAGARGNPRRPGRRCAAGPVPLRGHGATVMALAGRAFSVAPDAAGYYGPYGGAFVPEILRETLTELRCAFGEAQQDPS